MPTSRYTAILEKDGDLYVALCPALDVASQGATGEEVTANLSRALLSKQAGSAGAPGRRAQTPGTLRFLDLLIVGDEDRFVVRTVRISQLAPSKAAAASATILAAIPTRTGRVT